MSTPTSPATRRRRLALPVVLAGSVASLILALGLSPTVAAFTAQIQNTVDTAGSGTLIMQETNSAGTVTCKSTDGTTIDTNSATCSTINKYGGTLTMTPGQTVSTTVNIKNIGTADASSFTLTPGACAQSNNGTPNGSASDLCTKMTIAVTSGSTSIYSGTLAAFNASAINILTKLSTTSVPSGTSIPFTFAVTLPTGLGNTYAGLQVSQPLTWNFGAGS
ncbi:hypothetical protein NS220_02210 [Microbacterium testaceum]|uniref:Uncharacterized protein n=1 Tax=Microbacterium testaceum TaxID=2033 RepID=A0A147F0V4_MICTE|nr:hypothetical protein [Microbacterium testaceum]KTR96446.1 hypothetical protein NS220_02210 [Microbacterium testaceum]